MTVTLMKTKAEEQLAAQFASTAPLLPGGAWVPAARRAAFQTFARQGLPHRRIEAWKYTDLRNSLKDAFPPATCASRTLDDAMLAQALGPALHALPCIRLVLVNGRYVTKQIPAGCEPGGALHCGPLSAALGQPGYEWIEPHFAPAGDGDAVMALNAAFASDGIVLRVETGHKLALPIHIVSIVDASAPMTVATRHLLKVDAGARAVIIESHVRLGTSAAQATAVTHIGVETGGEAHHIKHLAQGDGSTHLGHTHVEIAEGAVYRGFQFTADTSLVRNETHIGFSGPDAKLDLSGLMLGRGRDHIDTTLVVHHSTLGCESRELFKSVLDDRARAVFQGKVIVDPIAQKTDGKQMAQALMLSEDAEFDSKPELEIYADDVACGHGSTVAEIDPAMLFYIRSRGIPKAQARDMLIESFVAEAIDKVEDAAVREALMQIARGWLAK